jgi:hypothetical protein
MSSFSFYLLCFFFYKIGEQREEQDRCSWHCWEGGGGGERGGRVNTVQIMCTHVCNCKNGAVEIVSGIRGGGMKESRGRG